MIERPGSFSFAPAVAPPAPSPIGSISESAARELDPRRLLATLWRRRRLLFGIWLAFIVAVFLFTLIQPKKYTTTTKLIAGNGASVENTTNADSNTNLPVLNALLAVSGQQSAETYAELIEQSSVSEEVIKDLHLNVSVGALLSHLEVRPVADTSLLSVSMTWSDPVTSAKIANAYADVFVQHERELVSRQADAALGYLSKALPDAENRMRAEQEALTAYQQQKGIADLTIQTSNSLNGASTLEQKLQQAEVDQGVADASLSAVQDRLASTPATIVAASTQSTNPVVESLRSKVSDLTSQLAAARRQYTDSFPTVVALKSELAEAQRQLASQPATVTSSVNAGPNPVYQALSQQETTLEAQSAAAQASIKQLQSEIQAQKPALADLPAESRRIADLERAVRSATGIYQQLHDRYQNALIEKTTALSDVTVTQAADPTVFTKQPNLSLNLLLGIMVGFVLAVTAVFLAEFFDDRFRSDEDVRERLGVPVLAMIPLVDGLDAKDSEWVRPLAVEAFYQLVASLRYSSTHPPRTIAFTSADQADGKSTVALNTAISLGQMKARVLIVDADLRRPSIHLKLNVSNDKGLSDVLVGVTNFDDAVRPTEHIGVSVLSSGRPAPNPVGLLQSEAFDALLKTARDRFDFIIIDGPALRSIVDGIVLGVKTEGTVLIISATSSEGRSVRSAIDKLRAVGGINLLGVVLNRARPDRSEAGSYYLGAGTNISLPSGSSA
jgi:capsular exopolysaccharide synthesis family protein